MPSLEDVAKAVDAAAEKGQTVEEFLQKSIDWAGLHDSAVRRMCALQKQGQIKEADQLCELFMRMYDLEAERPI